MAKSAVSKKLKKDDKAVAAPVTLDLRAEIKMTIERAELFEARARIAIAQTDIANAQLARKKAMQETQQLDKKKKYSVKPACFNWIYETMALRDYIVSSFKTATCLSVSGFKARIKVNCLPVILSASLVDRIFIWFPASIVVGILSPCIFNPSRGERP